MRIVLSDKADSDLIGIYRYLYERNRSAADGFIQRIHTNFENLAHFPFIGRERSSLAPGLRCLVVGLHLVFYLVGTDTITIVRVIDSRRDVEDEFQR
jgi:toxin ParE1/3/4